MLEQHGALDYDALNEKTMKRFPIGSYVIDEPETLVAVVSGYINGMSPEDAHAPLITHLTVENATCLVANPQWKREIGDCLGREMWEIKGISLIDFQSVARFGPKVVQSLQQK